MTEIDRTSFDLGSLERQDNDGTITPRGAAWLDGYNAQRVSDVHAEGYTPGGAEGTELLTAPEKIPAEYVTDWNSGAQESRDRFTDVDN
jgi:hypothetical protein